MMTAIECRQTVVPFRIKAQQLRDLFPAFSEIFWFMLSLLLFMVLGPFAAPIALIAVFNVDSEHRGWAEPEAAE